MASRKKGHKGAERKKPDHLDVIEHRRLEQCPGCAGHLIERGVARRHTTEDIVLTVRTIEYHLYRYHCPYCAVEHITKLPSELGEPLFGGQRLSVIRDPGGDELSLLQRGQV